MRIALKDQWECRRVKPLLQPFLDGELDDRQARRVARHLDACHRCGLAAETYRALKAALARLAEPADADAVRRLEQFVDDLTDSPPGRPGE